MQPKFTWIFPSSWKNSFTKLMVVMSWTALITANCPPVSAKDQRTPQPTIHIRGRVFDSKEPPNPLPGVSVRVKNKSIGTSTDATGNFELYAIKGDTLVFTFTGYKTFEYLIRNTRENLSISLEENVSALNQLVVTGYSEEKLTHLASAVSTVNIQSSVEGKPITQLSQALQGGATGLTVTQSSGMPGGPDQASIKIRGISTLGNTAPLVLVDGVPFPIDDVDPATVESITILKDAAAAAVYGARAANGVVVITTKRGKPGQVSISYQGYAGVQNPTYLPKFVDAVKYMQMANEAYANAGVNPAYSDSYIQNTKEGTNPLLYPNTNWEKLIINPNPFIQSHTLDVTGGNSLARFAVTGSYLKQEGLMKNTMANRFSLRANTSFTLEKNLSMYLDMAIIRNEQTLPVDRYPKGGLGPGGIFYLIYRIPPTIVAKYPLRKDGLESYGNFGQMENPVAELEKAGYSRVMDDNINVNFQPQWEIIPSLKLRGQYLFRVESSASIQNTNAYNFLDYYTNALVWTYPENKTSGVGRNTYQYLSATLDYDKSFNKHFVSVLGGVSREINNPSNFDQATLASYFVKGNYVYADKYLLEATYRADGSSLFGSGHKWGTFPSVAVGWNVSNEEFMKPARFVNNLKLRASYGLMGNNQNVGLYQYQSTINSGNGTEAVFGNPDITWETVKMLDIGADMKLLNNKFGMTVDWYNKITDNILLYPPLSLSSGLGSAPVNGGTVRNRGWEFYFSYGNNFTKNLRMDLSAGYSYYNNKILLLKGGPYINGTTINEQGYPIGSYYGYRTNGLLQQADINKKVPVFAGEQAGDIKYVDVNGDGVLNAKDEVILGNPNPPGNYFVNLRLAFRNVDLQIQVNGFTNSLGIYSGRYTAPIQLVGDGGIPMTWQTDYWTPTHTDAKLPRLTPDPVSNTFPSEYWTTNAAFVRVRYIELGYNLNSNWMKTVRLMGARIYFNAQNPLTFSKMNHLDPESQGTELTYPLMQFYTLGLNFKFE